MKKCYISGFLVFFFFTIGCTTTTVHTENKLNTNEFYDSDPLVTELRLRLKQTSNLLASSVFRNQSDRIYCSDADFKAGRCFSVACAPCKASALGKKDLCSNPGPLGTGLLCQVDYQGKVQDMPCCTVNGPNCVRIENSIKTQQAADKNILSNKQLFLPLKNRDFDINKQICLIN